MMDWRERLAQNDPAIWEDSYRTQVIQGDVADEDWMNAWLWHRLELPGNDYSIFNASLPLIQVQWMETEVVVLTSYEGKNRLVEVQIFGSNPYQADFEGMAVVADHERRFPSIGNPFVDEPNYRAWEEWLFAKLLHDVWVHQKGLLFLIDRFRSRFQQQG